jgi:hypothetical protein
MKGQFLPFAPYLPPETWPYWMPGPPTGGSGPKEDFWPHSRMQSSATSSGGLLGNFANPAGGILGNFAAPVENTVITPGIATSDPMGWDLATMPSVLLSSPLQNDRTQRDRSSQLLSGTNFPYQAGAYRRE